MEVVVTAGSGGKGTVWFSDPELEPLPVVSNEPLRFTTATIDLGEKREIGGLIIDWNGRPPLVRHGCAVPNLRGRGYSTAQPCPTQELVRGRSYVWLPEMETRTLHINGNPREVIVESPTWAPTKNDFYSIVAKAARRGDYPRYFVGEQSYWTVIGADGAENEALVGEDGNVEPFKGGDSIEPFLIVNGKRLTWAEVTR